MIIKEFRTRIYTFTEKLRNHVMPYDEHVDEWKHLNGVIYLGDTAKKHGFGPGVMVDIIIKKDEIIIKKVVKK